MSEGWFIQTLSQPTGVGVKVANGSTTKGFGKDCMREVRSKAGVIGVAEIKG